MNTYRFITVVILSLALFSTADSLNTPVVETPIVTGPGIGLGVSGGLIGVFASVNTSVLLPKITDKFQIGFRGSWSMPAVVNTHENAAETEIVTYLPWMLYGSVFMHLGSPVVKDLFKPYFGLELLAGTTKIIEDNYLGKNITAGIIPYVGIELYAKQSLAVFIEMGTAVIFTLTSDDSTVMGTMTQHGGTGFFIRMGPRFYFGGK